MAGVDSNTPEPPLQVLLGWSQRNTEVEGLEKLDWWVFWWSIKRTV